MDQKMRDVIKKKVMTLMGANLAKVMENIANDFDTRPEEANLEQAIYFIDCIFKQVRTNRFARYSHDGYMKTEGAFMKLSSYPLVKNADGKISAKESLAEITDPILQNMVKIIAYTTSRSRLIPTAKAMKPKHVYNATVPIWAFVHKLKNNVMYEDWSLLEEDMPELVFGKQQVETISQIREKGVYLKIQEELTYMRKITEENNTKSLSAYDCYTYFEIPSLESLELSKLAEHTLLQVGFSHPDVVSKYSIRNYLDLDKPADLIEGVRKSVNVNKIVAEEKLLY